MDVGTQEVAGSGDSQASQEPQGESDSSEPANSQGTPQSLENPNEVNNEMAAPLALLDTQDEAVVETEQITTAIEVLAEPVEELLPFDNPPVTQPDTLDITDSAPIEISSLLLSNDDDPDSSEPLNVISASGGTGSLEVDGNSVTYYPDQALLLSLGVGQTDTQLVTYEVESGGLHATGTLTVTYIGENEAPVLQSESAAISEDTLLELHVLDNATDSDTQDSLTIAGLDISNLTGTVEISADAQFLIYSPPQDMDSGTRTEVFSYLVSDGTATSTATVTITVTGVNDPPVIESDSSSFSVDAASGQVEIPLTAIFSDADSASVLTVVLLDGHSAQGGLLSEGSILYDPGNIFIYLGEGETTTDSFSITVEDQNEATGQGTFTFQVEGSNDAPMAYLDSDTLAENAAVSVDSTAGVLANDEDPDTSDMLVVSAIRSGGMGDAGVSAVPGTALAGSYGTLTLYADGSYDYQANLAAADALAQGVTAVDVFTYTVSDDALTSLSDSAELSFNLTGVNDAPTLLDATDANGAVSEIEDNNANELTAYLTDKGSFAFEDIDLDTHTVSVQPVTSNATSLGDFSVTVKEDTSVEGTGLVEWTFSVIDADIDYLEAEEALTQDYIVTVDDGQGGSFDQTVTVTLVGSYDAPNAPPYQNSDDIVYQQVVINESYSESFLFYDPDGDLLTLSYSVPSAIDGYLSATTGTSTTSEGYNEGTLVLAGTIGEGTVGDYLVTVWVDDAINAAQGDTYVLSIRDPGIIVEGGAHQFVTGEAELVVSDHGDDPGLGDVELIDAGPGDRVQFLHYISEVYLTSGLGSTVTLDFGGDGGYIDAVQSTGADRITLYGDIVDLTFIGLDFNDTLINETTIEATADNFTVDAAVENNGDIHVSSSSSGANYIVGYGSDYQQAHYIAGPAYTGGFIQSVSGLLEVSAQGGHDYGGYMLTLEMENAGLISVFGDADMFNTLVSVLEVQSISSGQLERGSFTQTASGTLSVSSGGIVSAGSFHNEGLVILESDYYNHASLLLDGSYHESGTLWSTTADSVYVSSVNVIHLHTFVLEASGEIIVDSRLFFSNPLQTLDLRLGQVTFDPSIGAIGLEGGTLILGENSDFRGYGYLGFPDIDNSNDDTGTILIDTSFSISNYLNLALDEAAVTISGYEGSTAELVVLDGELNLFDSDVINTDLVNQGLITVGGMGNEINGTFDNASGALVISVGYGRSHNSVIVDERWTTDSALAINSPFDNQGIIEIVATGHVITQPGSDVYPELNVVLTSNNTWINSGSIYVVDDLAVLEDDGDGNNPYVAPSHDFNVNIQTSIINKDLIQVEGGQVTITGNLTNAGTIRVIGSSGMSSELSSLSGSHLNITGNLILEPSSFVEVEVGTSYDDASTMTIKGIDASSLLPSANSADLGTLSLLFEPDHWFYPDNDPTTTNPSTYSMNLVENSQPGVNFSNVLTNLAAGYDVSWTESGGDIILEVSDGMEVVASSDAEFNAAQAGNDVRVIGAVWVQGTSQEINSFSIEVWDSNSSFSQGGLYLGNSDTTAETFELTVASQSAVAPDTYLTVGNYGGVDTSVLILDGLLTVNGYLNLAAGGQIRTSGSGSIVIADEGDVYIHGGTLDVDLTLLDGSYAFVGPYDGSQESELGGLGSITNLSTIVLDGLLGLGVDLDNQGFVGINGGASITLMAGSEMVFSNDGGLLATDGYDSVSLHLNDNVLDTRGGELALFINDSAGFHATLAGGAAGSDGIIMMDSGTRFASSGYVDSATDYPTLVLEGDLTLSLQGIVVFDTDDGRDLTLDGSTANSLNLINAGVEAAAFVNSGYMDFNNLTLASDVTIVNFNEINFSGVTRIEGDIYNILNSEIDDYADLDFDAYAKLGFDHDIIILGNIYTVEDSIIYVGHYTSDQVSLVFGNDFVNEGKFYFEPGNYNINSIEMGEGTEIRTFTNEGQFYAGENDMDQVMVLKGILINEGYLEVELGNSLTLNETSVAVTHENNGHIDLLDNSALTLGANNSLVNNQLGTFHGAADSRNTGSLLDLTAENASFVNYGLIHLGDFEDGDGNHEFRTSDVSGDVSFETGSQLNIDADLNSAAPLYNQLMITSTGSAGGVLRINGGFLNINQIQASASTSAVIITAVSILGSFDEVDGLVSMGDGQGGSPLLDMVQTGTSITLEPVAATEVLEGSESADSIDMSATTQAYVIAAGGDDVISHIGSGDTVYGEEGADTFELSAFDVRRIDGGAGIDSVALPDVSSAFDFRASAGWLGTTFDNIELLRMADTSDQTLHMDGADIGRIVDGDNELVGDAAALVVVGNIGDRVNLYGNFEAGEDRYAEIDGTPILFSEVSEDNVSLYFDQNTIVTVYETDEGTSIYGNAEGEVLTGTPFDETLSGRQGDDDLDAGLGMDVQLGGDGNDLIKYDGLDSLIDGGRGVDTAIITGNVDLSRVDNLENIEILDMSDNGTADTIELNLSDVLDIVGDNSLSGYEVESDNKVLVIKGDAEDTVLIGGLALDLISPDATDVDLFGDGELYYLYEDAGVSVYVHSDLVGSSAPPQAMVLDSYIHNSPVDAFGII